MLGVCLDSAVAHKRVRPPAGPVAVGDWVTLDAVDPDRIGTIAERATVLRRGAVGAEGREQLIASNLDVVFVVSAFATTEKLERRGLNPRRMERYVAARCHAGGSTQQGRPSRVRQRRTRRCSARAVGPAWRRRGVCQRRDQKKDRRFGRLVREAMEMKKR